MLTPVFGQEVTEQGSPSPKQASFPDSSIPGLFSPDSAASRFAQEPADPVWSSSTEGLIRAEIEKAGVPALRRVEVECRTSVCAILYVFSDTSNKAKQKLDSVTSTLRETAGFNAVELAMSDVPVAGAGGYAEVVLHRTRLPEAR
jgi:hypothetical protein